MPRFIAALSTDGSLRKKFGASLLFALVLVFPPIMLAVDLAARRSVAQEIMLERDVDMRVHAASLSKSLYDFDYANLRRMAGIIAKADDIDVATVFDINGEPVAASPDVGRNGGDASAMSIEILHGSGESAEPIGRLKIWFNTDRATKAIRDFYWRTGMVITLSLILVYLAMMASIRHVMLRPMGALMQAIESSRAGGERVLARWTSRDEMGRLVDHFNAMQVKLSQEGAKLKAANAHLTTLYHQTPAMLFSLDLEGRIADVSDYWLLETGYGRDEVIDQPLNDFLESADARPAILEDCDSVQRASGPSCGGFGRWNCRFRKKSGELIDVFVSESLRPMRLGDDDRILLVMVDISDLKQAEEELLRRSLTDSLTGLPNRRHFKEKLSEALTTAEVKDERVDVFFLDLDRFKWVNDHLGHQAGDELLNSSAARIIGILPQGAFFARLGGDEFGIFLQGGDAETAASLSRSVNDALSTAFQIADSSISISASIGVAAFPQDSATVGGLLRAADLAMYRTKRAGRRGFSRYEESIGDEARRLFEVEEMMKSGSMEERFHLDFQPLVRLEDQRIIGAEGLLRMRDPQGGVVPPGDFIAIAEESGLMRDLGGFALRRGARDFAAVTRDAGVEDLRLSINLSALQVAEELPEEVAAILETTAFPAQRLVLEITESVFLKQDAALLTIFERVRGLGCRLALDDFGTGYSSLSYLNDFPVDIVKIDRQFVRRLDGDGGQDLDATLQRRARSLLQGVVAIAHELDFLTVAEGVETQEQRRLVTAMGVDFGQGFLWSKPLSPEKFGERLSRQRAGMVDPISHAAG